MKNLKKSRKFYDQFTRWGGILTLCCALPALATCNQLGSLTDALGLTEEDSGLDPALLLLGLSSSGCSAFNWNLPAGFPTPSVPADNCMTPARVELGRHLFYDKRLSADESMSCATCHQQGFGFTDRVTTPKGIPHGAFPTGETHPRNTQHLTNVGYVPALTWANSTQTSLEVQVSGPLFNISGPSTIVELGLEGDAFLEKLKIDPIYQTLFASAYGADSYSNLNVRKAIAAFQRTMISGNSPYDRFVRYGESLSSTAVSGALVFFGENAECFHCHGGFNFTDTSLHNQTVFTEVFYHNNGLYTAAEYGAKNMNERGLIDVTGLTTDEGRFRAPSLRNVSVTFPYMHDGTFACDGAHVGNDVACARNALEKVIDHYISGGKTHPTKDVTLIRSFTLTAQEKSDMIDFLFALQDDSFLTDTKFSNPQPGNGNFGP